MLDAQTSRNGNGIGGGVVAGVGEADLDFGDAVLLGELGGGSLEHEFRRAGRIADDFQIEPAGLAADAGAERFGNRLFGGKAGGVVQRRSFSGPRSSRARPAVNNFARNGSP